MKMLGGESLDYRSRMNLYLALAAIFLLAPFAINNLIEGRTLLGIGSAALVLILAAKAWLITTNRATELFSLLVLVPIILGFTSLSVHQQGIIGILWCYPALLGFFVLLSERKALFASGVLVLVIVPQAAVVLDPGLAARAAVTLTAVGIFTGIFAHAMTDAQSKLERLATTDPLTGLLNRSTLLETIQQSIDQNRRNETPMTLLACDIDHFKPINDEFGHAIGDEVLSGLGQLMIGRFRVVDSVFRTGGEEFLVVLYDSDLATAREIAEELRETVQDKELVSLRRVTISIGVASLEKEDDAESWIQRADEHLYEAKREGRNRVVAKETWRERHPEARST